MPIWRISDNKPVQLDKTSLKQEDFLEENLEDWVVEDPSLLGEPLLVIGRQVTIPEVKDRLDLLALDPQGKAVIIELKRGKLKNPVDMQALRYASYISKWGFEDFENQARNYWGKVGDPEFSFNDSLERFCTDAGVDEVPDLNSDQRMVIVGSEVKDKLGSVALWLRDHEIDIKVIEVEAYREGEAILVHPNVIIPLPVSSLEVIGRRSSGDGSRPWLTDGKAWHLDKSCGAKTREMLLTLDDLIRDNLDVDGPHWNQKQYVSYRVASNIWLAVHTYSSNLLLSFLVKAGVFNQAQLARRLGVEEFDKEDSLSEKLGLPSSVRVTNRRNRVTDRVSLRIKQGFGLESEEFLSFLREAYEAFPK